MESELSSVQQAYDAAKAASSSLQKTSRSWKKIREELTGNIATLNEEKELLIKNIYALREGQVVFQAGQVLTSVVVDEDMDENRSREVLQSVLSDINGMLKERLNITDEGVNLVRMSQRDFDESVAQVTGAKT